MLNYVFKQLVKHEEDNAWKPRVKETLNNLEIRDVVGLEKFLKS